MVVACDGRQGVELAGSAAPDLILMDINLPVLDGWEATRLIRAADGTRDIPIIALTAHALTSDRQKTLDAGCDDYHTKPVEFPRLLTQIESLLRGRAAPAPAADGPLAPSGIAEYETRRGRPGRSRGRFECWPAVESTRCGAAGRPVVWPWDSSRTC